MNTDTLAAARARHARSVVQWCFEAFVRTTLSQGWLGEQAHRKDVVRRVLPPGLGERCLRDHIAHGEGLSCSFNGGQRAHDLHSANGVLRGQC